MISRPTKAAFFYATTLREKAKAAPRGIVETPPKVIRFEP